MVRPGRHCSGPPGCPRWVGRQPGSEDPHPCGARTCLVLPLCQLGGLFAGSWPACNPAACDPWGISCLALRTDSGSSSRVQGSKGPGQFLGEQTLVPWALVGGIAACDIAASDAACHMAACNVAACESWGSSCLLGPAGDGEGGGSACGLSHREAQGRGHRHRARLRGTVCTVCHSARTLCHCTLSVSL